MYKRQAFCAAEEITHTMHNLLTLRGAKVRNGLLWSKYIDDVIARYGNDVEMCIRDRYRFLKVPGD